MQQAPLPVCIGQRQEGRGAGVCRARQGKWRTGELVFYDVDVAPAVKAKRRNQAPELDGEMERGPAACAALHVVAGALEVDLQVRHAGSGWWGTPGPAKPAEQPCGRRQAGALYGAHAQHPAAFPRCRAPRTR